MTIRQETKKEDIEVKQDEKFRTIIFKRYWDFPIEVDTMEKKAKIHSSHRLSNMMHCEYDEKLFEKCKEHNKLLSEIEDMQDKLKEMYREIFSEYFSN